jgi:hypothetical protein
VFSGGCCEHGNDHSGSITYEEFLQFKDSDPGSEFEVLQCLRVLVVNHLHLNYFRHSTFLYTQQACYSLCFLKGKMQHATFWLQYTQYSCNTKSPVSVWFLFSTTQVIREHCNSEPVICSKVSAHHMQSAICKP